MPATPLIETLAHAFDSAGWNFRRVPGHDVLQSGFEAHHSKISLHAQTFEEIRAASVVATASITVPPPLRVAAAELLMRTNETLTVGNFELLWDTGQILFRTTNIFADTAIPDPGILTGMVQNAVAETDRITPYLATLIREPGSAADIPHLLARPDLTWEAAPEAHLP